MVVEPWSDEKQFIVITFLMPLLRPGPGNFPSGNGRVIKDFTASGQRLENMPTSRIDPSKASRPAALAQEVGNIDLVYEATAGPAGLLGAMALVQKRP